MCIKWLLHFFIFIPFFAPAQKGDTVLKYLDEELNFTTAKNAAFLGVAVKRTDGWFFYGLYPDTTPLIKAYYKDKALKIKEGPYTLYHPKNIKAQEGTFHNNKKSGIWRFWYPNGILKDSGMIVDNTLSGQWKSWYSNGNVMADCFFTTALQQSPIEKYLYTENIMTAPTGLRQGPFTSWYQNGVMEATGHFENNAMEGEWKWYRDNGSPATIETYEKGVMTELKCFDSTGKETGDYCSITKPALLKRYGDYKQYIYQYLTWPEEAKKKGIEGDVKVNFTITVKGQLENLKIQSAFPILNKAVEELFATMKEWYPAISHNRTINVEEEFVIPFRLNK